MCGRIEAVADATHGLDEGLGPTFVQFLPQSHDKDFHGAGIVFVFALPDAFADFVATEGAAWLLEEEREHFEFTWGKTNHFRCARHLALQDVHFDIGHLQCLAGNGRALAAA